MKKRRTDCGDVLQTEKRCERFFSHPLLPFVEARYSSGSTAFFKPHLHHDRLSIGAALEGQVLYRAGSEEELLCPGNLAIINPDIMHSCNPVGGVARNYYMLYVDVGWCLQVQQSLWKVHEFIPLVKTKIANQALYRRYCRALKYLIQTEAHLEAKEQILYDLMREVFSAGGCALEETTLPHWDMAHVKGRLMTDLRRDLPVWQLAAELDLNPCTLIRRFKAETGSTPHAFRMNCRIEYARSLLRKGADIGDTALECGFFDQSHFHREFKAMTSVTPNQYLVNFVQYR